MGKKDARRETRRKDAAHDVGDTSPGDYGDSKGTHHDGRSQTFNPDDAEEWDPDDH